MLTFLSTSTAIVYSDDDSLNLLLIDCPCVVHRQHTPALDDATGQRITKKALRRHVLVFSDSSINGMKTAAGILTGSPQLCLISGWSHWYQGSLS